MSAWSLLQIVINLSFLLGFFVLWTKFKKPQKDDPRMSRGLQLLQSKIAVLEDLSDRTDVQFRQLSGLLDKKMKDIHVKVEQAGKMLREIERSSEKSLEISRLFEDKIPHKEVIERENQYKYKKASQLAHLGKTVSEIAQQVDLPLEEIELIAKMNKETLLYGDENPEPYSTGSVEDNLGYDDLPADTEPQTYESQDYRTAFEPVGESDSVQDLELKFKKAVNLFNGESSTPAQSFKPRPEIKKTAPPEAQKNPQIVRRVGIEPAKFEKVDPVAMTKRFRPTDNLG